MRRQGQIFRFGEFRLDVDRRILSSEAGRDVPLPDAAFDALCVLVDEAGEIVDKAELMSAVWPHVSVTENSLNQAISSLRRALGDSRAEPQYVATAAGRGYRFVAQVVVVGESSRDPTAYQHYVLGLSNLTRPTRQSLEEAMRHFEQALAIEPDCAPAWAALAEYFHLMSAHGFLPGHEPLRRGYAAARRAIELDPDLVDAQVVEARMREIITGNKRDAELFYRTIIARHPRCYAAHRYLGIQCLHFGQLDEALSLLRKAQTIQPLAVVVSVEIGMALYFGNRYAEAIAQLELALGMDSAFELTHAFLGRTWIGLGEHDRAIESFDKAPTSNYGAASGIPIALAASGKTRQARAMLVDLLQRAEPPARTYDVAQVYAALGDDENALSWLERAADDRSAAFFGVNPVFARLKQTSRMQALANRNAAGE